MKTFRELTRKDYLHCMSHQGEYCKLEILDVLIDESDDVVCIYFIGTKGKKRKITVKGNETRIFLGVCTKSPYEHIRTVCSCSKSLILEFEEEIKYLQHHLNIYEDNLKKIKEG